MNFKEQMQKKVQEGYPLGDYYAGSPQWFIADSRSAFIHGSRAALSSDLVKGLFDKAEALEKLDTECYLGGAISDIDPVIGEEFRQLLTDLRTALHNYKQEINHLNECNE